MDKEIFVQKVKYFCDRKGVRPTVACREAGVSTSFITNVCKGSMPSIEKVQLLATYLGCTVSDLLGEENPPAVTDEGKRAWAKAAIDQMTDAEFDALTPMLKMLGDKYKDN